LSKPVILDKAIRDEVDPVVLGEAGVSVYEIRTRRRSSWWMTGLTWKIWEWTTTPTQKTLAPLRWPKQKVWLASDVHRTSPVQYSKVNTTSDRPDISTARTPRAQSTRRQGRSMVTPEGNVISEARIRTIPYMAVWMMFFCIFLTMIMNPAMALSDHDRQVIAYSCGRLTEMRAYDTGERNHWCDLNPIMDSNNTDITLTNILYVLLQKVRCKIRTCKVTKTVVPLYCTTQPSNFCDTLGQMGGSQQSASPPLSTMVVK
jgi:hypothetical protein